MREQFQKHGMEISDDQLQKLTKFLEIFLQTNSEINLSAIRNESGVIHKHFIDSCMLHRYESRLFFSGATFLDIGTGGGFPTIPLAILNPDCIFYALDTRKKKVSCVEDFCKQLGLTNVVGVWGRAEDISTWEKVFGERKIPPYFDTIITRATAHLSMLAEWSDPLLDDEGRLCVYKTPSDEELQDGLETLKKHNLKLQRTHDYLLEQEVRQIFVIK